MSIDPLLYRQVAGSFASGITVITTGSKGAYHGMTASAFTSLSIEPGLVLVCIDGKSETRRVIEGSGAFNVNILRADQEHLSRAFSKPKSPESYGLHGIEYRIGCLGTPILKDALAFFECRLLQTLAGGDHVIFVGEVENAGSAADELPILHYRGRYRSLKHIESETSPVPDRRADLTGAAMQPRQEG